MRVLPSAWAFASILHVCSFIMLSLQIRMTTILPCLVCLSVMWLNYGAIMWCSFRVRRTLKRRMSLSVDIRQRTASSVNRQISIVMMFQVSAVISVPSLRLYLVRKVLATNGQ